MVYTASESALNPPLLDANLTKVGTTKLFDLGTKIETKTGKTFRYCKATGTLAQYLTTLLDASWNASAGVEYAAAASGVGPKKLGVHQAGALVSGQYAWFQTAGNMTVIAGESVDVGDKLYTTSTAGELGDTSASQSLIEGLTATAAVASPGNVTAYGTREIEVRTAV